MKRVRLPIFLILLFVLSCNIQKENREASDYDQMMIRIAEIEIEPGHLEAYLAILKEESEASVQLEPGVICIYPMYQQEHPNQIRLLEIYVSKTAYESHLETPHFKKYKTNTLHMVRSLKLIDMKTIDPETMPKIFKKLSS